MQRMKTQKKKSGTAPSSSLQTRDVYLFSG